MALEAARSSTRGCVAGRSEGWLFPGSTEPPRATRRALTTGGTGTELGHCPDYTLNRAATPATDRPARRRLSWLAAAAAIFSAKSEVTMKSFAAAVLAATAWAGSSGYLSVRVYLSPLPAAVHAALKSSSVSAYDAPVRGMYGTPGAGSRTAHVQHLPPGASCPEPLVQHAGGWYGTPGPYDSTESPGVRVSMDEGLYEDVTYGGIREGGGHDHGGFQYLVERHRYLVRVRVGVRVRARLRVRVRARVGARVRVRARARVIKSHSHRHVRVVVDGTVLARVPVELAELLLHLVRVRVRVRVGLG